MKSNYLILCDSWNEAHQLWQDTRAVMTLNRELRDADFKRFAVELTSGAKMIFTGKKDRYAATRGFHGTVIESHKFIIMLHEYAHRKGVKMTK